jgi:NAD(P)-dependent dehydrogenase (short-subunit alcohol dehydrogenase family)
MKQILLTGGAGGLGRAVAEHFADRGASVFSCDIKEQKEYDGIVPIWLDLRDALSIDAAREKVEAAVFKLDAVIHRTYGGVRGAKPITVSPYSIHRAGSPVLRLRAWPYASFRAGRDKRLYRR